MKKVAMLLLLGLGACDSGIEPETKSQATQFPLRADWNAAVAPLGTNTVQGSLTIKEYLGQRMQTTASLTGGRANTAYQWRVYRGNCATTTAAANNTDPNGLLLFATIQSYPDITANAAGTGTITRQIAGQLDSLTEYSVRIRLATAQTNWNGTSPLACGNLQRS